MSYLPERIEATGRKLCYELKIFEAMGRIKSYMLVDIQTITRKQSYRLNDVEAIGWMSIPHRMDPTWCPHPAGWAQGGRLLRPGNPPTTPPPPPPTHTPSPRSGGSNLQGTGWPRSPV